MIQVFIDGVDRSNDVEKETYSFSQGKTNRNAQVRFRIKKRDGRVMPELNEDVLVVEDGENIFRGRITEQTEEMMGTLVQGFKYVCKDDTFDFDRKLVAKAFVATDSHQVAASIITGFTEGFTYVLEGDPVTIDTIRFNYEQPSKCMQTLCEAIGFDWYIDADDVVHFFPAGSRTAPFNIEESNDRAYYKSISKERNIIELKNAVYVRGGFYLDEIEEADAVDKYVADGEQRAFPLAYRYKQIQVKLNGVTQAVGIDFIDDENEFDVLYNYQQKSIRFRENNKPDEGDVVTVFGNAEVPLIVRAQDNDSIAAYGLVEGVVIDSTITSVEQANLVAAAQLAAWRDGSYEGKFVTREKGLRAGQSIEINVPSRGIDDTFIINRITGVMKGDEMEYTVEFLKTGSFTFTDIMLELLGRARRNLVISDDDVVQRFLELTDDEFNFDDELISITTRSGPYTYGVGSSNPGEWGFSTWG